MKGNKQQTNELNELIDKFEKIHKYEHINKMHTEGRDTGTKVLQLTENMDTECNERPPQSIANKAMDKKEVNKHMQEQEVFTMMRLVWISIKTHRLHYFKDTGA